MTYFDVACTVHMEAVGEWAARVSGAIRQNTRTIAIASACRTGENPRYCLSSSLRTVLSVLHVKHCYVKVLFHMIRYTFDWLVAKSLFVL